MGLFQKSVVKGYLDRLDMHRVSSAFDEYKSYFNNPITQQNIRKAKEEQYQEGFLRELFVKIMGYTINPDPGFNLTTEQKNISDSKKADGAIIINDKVTGVIELKGTNTIDLGKIQQQAFYYLSAHPEAVYVVTSNFEKLRFYIQKSNEYEEFNLFALTLDEFKVLYLCLSYDSISNGLPLKIKQESVVKEENITKQLYKDYSNFKNDLFHNLCDKNPTMDKLTLFKASQKLIDRFLFILFCEDNNGLLPANSISEIIKHWNKLREMDEYKPLYDIFKKYFEYINSGRTAVGDKQEIFAFNGGLFSTDTLLDQLLIEDNILYTHSQKLSTYDFISEVDVNILGHIFEHSLNEIEEIQAELEGNPVDKSKTKRKKDGVFYTPKYITEYIVENTIGKLCTDKKAELGIDEDKFVNAKTAKERTPLQEQLIYYKQYVLSLTICDPACGSGAFLNQAYVFLQKEHQYIADLESKLFNAPMGMVDVSADILENNLFGVDINEESVEIARLALWLRSAKKGRKLNNLSNNIKCGNSLIDDPAVAGDKAFNWEKEFPQVFDKGGFDVVIGNPPYGAKIEKNEISFISKKYDNSLTGEVDTYIVFYFASSLLLKSGGVLGFITPDTWLTISRGKGLRNFIVEKYSICDIYDRYKPFNDAKDTRCHTVIYSNNKNLNSYNLVSVTVVDSNQNIIKNYKLNQIEFKGKEIWNLYTSPYEQNIFNKMIANSVNLESIYNLKYGLRTGDNSKYLTKILSESDLGIKIARGSNIERYYFNWQPEYLLTNNNLPLSYFEHELLNSPKLIIQYVRTNSTDIKSKWLEATIIEENNFIPLNSTSFIYLKSDEYVLEYLLTIISSNLMNYYYKAHYTDVNVKPIYLSKLPIIPVKNTDQIPFVLLAQKMIDFNKEKKIKENKYLTRIQSNFHIVNITGKLEKFYESDFKTFVGELKKQKVVLSLKDQDEWEDYFNSYKQEINTLQAEIDKTDKEIDQMVYELYGLTEEEIAVVEGSN